RVQLDWARGAAPRGVPAFEVFSRCQPGPSAAHFHSLLTAAAGKSNPPVVHPTALKSMGSFNRTIIPNGFFTGSRRTCGIATPCPTPVDPSSSRITSTEKNIRIDLQHEGSSAGEIVQQRSLTKHGNVNNGIDDLADML